MSTHPACPTTIRSPPPAIRRCSDARSRIASRAITDSSPPRRSSSAARQSAAMTICSDRCPGVDGIKTGFTNASGFNLLTSVHRDGRYLIGVVLGGRSAGERDAHMRALDRGQHPARFGAPHRAGHRRTRPHDDGYGGSACANAIRAKEIAAQGICQPAATRTPAPAEARTPATRSSARTTRSGR